MTDKTPQQILDFLTKIDKGEITVTPTYNPEKHYCGNLEYKCSNGYTVIVFNDCHVWDYIEHIFDEKDNVIFFFTFEKDDKCPREYEKFKREEWEIIRDYTPTNDNLWGF